MSNQTFGLEHFEFASYGTIYRNLTVQELVEHEYKNGEVQFGPNGAVMVDVDMFPERLPEDKFYVDEASTTENMWWGSGNKKISVELFERLQARVLTYLSGPDLYLNDMFCGSDKQYQVSLRMVSKKAWHAHFFNNLYLQPTDAELEKFQPEYTIFNACGYEEHEFLKMGLNSKTFILVNFDTKVILIGGTENSDEMKEIVFSLLNYVLPLKGVLTLHCSSNQGKENDVALFLGGEGSGKTTLSNDPNKRSWHRRLIGDDIHGWTDDGIVNLENGCYAKCLNLIEEAEPDIYQAIRFGAVMENVVYNEKRVVDYDDGSRTENTRATYSQDFIHNSIIPGVAEHPQTIILLANDMYGVLPPVAKLTSDQAIYYFLAGYECKAVMKDGKKEIVPKFSFCFGESSLTLRPNIYAELLAQKIERHGVNSYLVNTGWNGGSFGAGKRIPLSETRRVVNAILDGSIDNSIFEKDLIFGFDVPKQLTGVDATILNPEDTWSDKKAFEETRKKLANMFIDNFEIYAKDGPQTGDVIATKYLYNEYNKLSAAGPHL